MEVGAHGFGGELVFDEEFAREVEHAGVADTQAGDVDLVTGFDAADEGELIGEGDVAFGRGGFEFGDEVCLFEKG